MTISEIEPPCLLLALDNAVDLGGELVHGFLHGFEVQALIVGIIERVLGFLADGHFGDMGGDAKPT